MNSKIKVGFFLPSLTSGGAERIMAYLSQTLDNDRFETVLVSVGHEEDTKYEVSNTKVIYLNKNRVLSGFMKLIGVLRREKFDVTISAIRHMNAIMGIISPLFPKTKFIGREVNVMSVLDNYKEPNDREYPKWLYKLAFKQLDAIVCQSIDMKNDLTKEFPRFASKYRLINNPITSGFEPKQNKTPNNPPYQFITVASLEPRKGHLRILEGLSQLTIDFKYLIVGSGSMLDEIRSRIKELGLISKVKHIPYTNEVNKYLQQSHIFIQGSYVEGFPNALLESCAVGTPVIAFDAPGGINEIIDEGTNGFVVKDSSELKEKIELILHSKKFVPSEISESVFKKYHSSVIVSKYENLFEELANS